MKLLLVIMGFAFIAVIDLPDMIKNKLWRDIVLYSAVFLPVLALAILVALGFNIPSPIKAIQAFYRDLLHLSF